MREYASERCERSLKDLEQARRVCLERDGSSSAVVISLWELLGVGLKDDDND